MGSLRRAIGWGGKSLSPECLFCLHALTLQWMVVPTAGGWRMWGRVRPTARRHSLVVRPGSLWWWGSASRARVSGASSEVGRPGSCRPRQVRDHSFLRLEGGRPDTTISSSYWWGCIYRGAHCSLPECPEHSNEVERGDSCSQQLTIDRQPPSSPAPYPPAYR